MFSTFQWDLVCDRKWIVAMITTIQMTGVLVGCFICGHLGDFIGRKPTYFLSLIIQIVFNFVAYFCPNWQLYAAIRFVLGVGKNEVSIHWKIPLNFYLYIFFARFASSLAFLFHEILF